jgi:hypothetical protein
MKKILIILLTVLLTGCSTTELLSRDELLSYLETKYKEEFDIKKIEYSKDMEIMYIVNPKKQPKFNFYVKNYLHSDGPVGLKGRKVVVEDNYTVDTYYHLFSQYLINNNIKYKTSDLDTYYNSINYIITFNKTNYKDIANKLNYFITSKKEVFPFNEEACGYIQFKLEGTEYASFYETNLCKPYDTETLKFDVKSLIDKQEVLININETNKQKEICELKGNEFIDNKCMEKHVN